MRLRMLFWIGVAMIAGVADARAQVQPAGAGHRFFVEGHAGPHWDDRYSDADRIPGAVLETGLSVGLDSPASGIEADISVPAWHEWQYGAQRFRYAGISTPYLQKDHFYESTSTVWRRTIEVGFMYKKNYHPNEIVTLSVLVGGASLYRPTRSSGVTKEVLPDGSLVEVSRYDTESAGFYHPAGTAGIDVRVRLSKHLDIVPRLRFTAPPLAMLDDSGNAPQLFWTRPQIAMRWTF